MVDKVPPYAKWGTLVISLTIHQTRLFLHFYSIVRGAWRLLKKKPKLPHVIWKKARKPKHRRIE